MVLLLVMSPGFGQRTSGGDTLEPSTITLPELRTEETTAERFSTIMTMAGASGGMAIIHEGCSHGPRRNVSIKEGTTLSQALDDLALDARSKWQLKEGVVNMLPSALVPPLLETSIRTFEWNKSKSLTEAVGRLLGLPEVTQRARELGLKREPGGAGSTGVCIRDCPKESDPVIEVEKDATLLAILNHIVQSRDRAIWGYSEFHCNNETRFTLSIIAE